MFNKSRNWKWIVPSTLVPVMYLLWYWMMLNGWDTLAILPASWSIIFLIAALINLVIYGYEQFGDKYADIRAVTHATPEVRMFEAAKGMHPDAVKALLVHRRSVWRIKYIPSRDVVDWIFDEIPNVHAGFVDYVLDNSNNVTVMAKRGRLSEGSMQFDPEGLVSDYDQYDALIGYLKVHLMCTDAYGSSAPKWLPPWNVDLVRHRFGLDGAPYAVDEEGVSEAMQSVLKEQARWQGKGLKDLGSVQPVPQMVPAKSNGADGHNLNGNGNGNGAQKTEDVRQQDAERKLTDAEWDAIQAEVALDKSHYRE